ncbi:hypothetical protein BDC45DRAFT_611491 [Circinella umbellata]|nr:hypothetical protein BDC45DRAFT_611491 [Circinella umbellata]
MADNDTIKYLKLNCGPNFSVVEFFKYFAFAEEDDGVQEFKRAIKALVTSKDATYVSWAKKIHAKHFMILRDQNVKHMKTGDNSSGKKKKVENESLVKSSKRKNNINTESTNKKQKDVNQESQINILEEKPCNQQELLNWLGKFQALASEDDKIKSSVDTLGQDGELDLEVLQVSSWYKVIIERSLTDIKFPYMLTSCEAQILSYIHHCTSINELKALRRNLYKYDDVDDGIEYIRMAIDSLSECSSTIVDAFNGFVFTPYNQSNQKVDFALRNVEDGNDMMVGEDKAAYSSSRDAETDYSASCTVPELPGNYDQVAKLLMTVLSLKTKENSFELDTDGMLEFAKLIVDLKYEEDQFVTAINEIEVKDNGSVMITENEQIACFRKKASLSEISTIICQKYFMDYDEDEDNLSFNLNSQEFDSSTPKRSNTPQL